MILFALKWNLCITVDIFIDHRAILQLAQVINMIYQIIVIFMILQFFASCFAQLAKIFLLF